jgi:hypothetical protein
MYLWNWILDSGSPPVAITPPSFGDVAVPEWLYPSETADLMFSGVSLTAVAGITAFSAAYMAYVGFTEYDGITDGVGGSHTLNDNFMTPQGQPLFMQYLSPFLVADDITSITVAWGLIPAGLKVSDNPPAGMPSPTSGLSVIVVGYD